MLEVTLRVPVQAGWRASDRLQVFSDVGSGSLDADNPLLTCPLAMFPNDVRSDVTHGGWGADPWGSVPWGGVEPVSPFSGGWGADPWGSVPWGGAKPFIEVRVWIGEDFADYKFAAQAIDGAGNVQGSLVEFTHLVSGENPHTLKSFALDSYDAETDTITFTFEV